MYLMLCGYPPFDGRTDAEVHTRVCKGSYTFETEDWKKVSADARSLIKMLLQKTPSDRCTAEQAISHDWIRKKAPANDVELSEGCVKNMRSFRAAHVLKKAALHI